MDTCKEALGLESSQRNGPEVGGLLGQDDPGRSRLESGNPHGSNVVSFCWQM